MEDILNHLKALGFNSYESKVYLALVKQHPATGYEVSKKSGVPQARAYDTLKVLEDRNIVVASGTKPVSYSPIAPQELLKRCERSFNTSVDFLKENLSNLSDDVVEPIFNIRGTKTIFRHAIEIIEHAKKEIFVEIWGEDFETLKCPLKKAYDRGVDIKIVGYKGVNADFGLIYQHGLSDSIEKSLGGRWLVIAADHSEGLAGTVSEVEKTPQAVWTKNPGIVLIMKEVIVHDMFLLDVESKLGESLNKVYGKDLINLREKILGKDFSFSAH
jgi:sugar-specific transcriptional regulator TrmB